MNQTFKLSLKPDDYPPRVPVVYANQYDVGRPFQATILDVDDSEYTFTNETVAICGTKPDGTGFSYDVTASGHVVTFTTTGQMTVVHGFVRCGIIITQGSTVIGTLAFLMYVQPAALQTGTIISSDDFGSIITDAVADWMDEHGVVIDNTLSVAGAAADAKKTGDEIADLKSAIAQNSGLTEDVKVALLACFENIGGLYLNENARTYIENLRSALYPPVDLSSISAVYTQSGTVYADTSLDDLRADLVVTAHYEDSSSENVTNYLLSGALHVGQSVVTVTYSGKSTTFNVTVSVDDRKVLTYAIGGIDTEGADSEASNRIRTDFIPVSTNDLVVTGTELDFTIRLYDANKAYVGANGEFVKYYKSTGDGYVRLIFKKSDNSDFTAHELDEYVVDTSADYYFLGAQPSEILNLVIQNGMGVDPSTGASVANANRALSAVSPISYSPLMVHYITEEESAIQMISKFVDSSGNAIMSTVPSYSPNRTSGARFGNPTNVLFMASTGNSNYTPMALPSGAVGAKLLFANGDNSSSPIESIPSGRVIINGKIYNAVEGTL